MGGKRKLPLMSAMGRKGHAAASQSIHPAHESFAIEVATPIETFGRTARKDSTMPRTLAFVALLAFASPVAGQPVAVPVDLTNFRFTPAQIELKANVPAILQLRNAASGGHSFSAPAFFAAAHVDPASAGLIREGKIEVPAHSTVQVTLTAAAGQYPLKCSHPFHSSLGMKGTIVVR